MTLPRLTREFAIVTLVSGTLVTVLYIPQGFLLGLNEWQWWVFNIEGIFHDFVVGLIVGEFMIHFNDWARKRNWY